MKSFLRWVDRFCARHPRFGVDDLMKYLVIGNVVVLLLTMMDRTGTVEFYLALDPRMVLRGQIWRLVTFALIPQSRSMLALLFLYFYYFIGTSLEREWGSAKFNVYVLSGMLFTILYCFIAYFITGRSMSVNAEYIYLSMFFAFAAYYPDMQVLLFFFIPMKVKWLALVDAAFFLMSIFTSPFPYSLLPLVATANFLLFCGDLLFSGFSPESFRRRKKAANFRREASRIRAEQRNAPYRFQCAVCGRTDVSNPELEFRYCSKCQGYHCFCQDHINNHIHFTQ
ncbi:MAG: hypothetical protein IKO22_02805 [Oscillospiraceae bacterium]|nr:hypothetical protein [Oscillospiraceae bacterium]